MSCTADAVTGLEVYPRTRHSPALGGRCVWQHCWCMGCCISLVLHHVFLQWGRQCLLTPSKSSRHICNEKPQGWQPKFISRCQHRISKQLSRCWWTHPSRQQLPPALLLMAVTVTSEGTGGSAKGAAGSGLACSTKIWWLHCVSCITVTFSPPKKTKRQYLEMSLCFQLNFLSEYWKRRNLPDGQKNTTTQTQNKQRKDKEGGWKQGMLEHFSTSKGPIWHSDHWLFPAFTTMVVAKSVLCKQHLP